MVTTLQLTNLSWDIESPVEYQAGQELQFTVNFTAPGDGKSYLMGALYSSDLSYISGTLFGLLKVAGADYAVNGTTYMSYWDLKEGESVELPCKLTLDRTNVVLGLFLFQMEGDTASLGVDEEVDALSAALYCVTAQNTADQVMEMVLMAGIVGFMAYEALKD